MTKSSVGPGDTDKLLVAKRRAECKPPINPRKPKPMASYCPGELLSGGVVDGNFTINRCADSYSRE